jgi:hypothetical protein
MKLIYPPLILPEFRVHLRTLLLPMGLVLIVSALAFSAVFLLHWTQDVPFGNLTRDPTAIMEAPFYTGFLSQLGIIFWAATAAISLFSATVIAPTFASEKRFLYASGLFILMLAADDLFLLHEGLFP